MALTNINNDMYEENVLLASEVFSEHGNFILAVIRSRFQNEDQANDLFQNFFLSLIYQPIPEGVNNVKSYLYRAIINDIVDAVRREERYKNHIRKFHKNGKQLNYSINKTNPENALIEKEQLDRLLTLIKGRLSTSEYQAITLRYSNNHSINEVAKKMGINTRSVSRYISIGLKKIRQFLAVKRGN